MVLLEIVLLATGLFLSIIFVLIVVIFVIFGVVDSLKYNSFPSYINDLIINRMVLSVIMILCCMNCSHLTTFIYFRYIYCLAYFHVLTNDSLNHRLHTHPHIRLVHLCQNCMVEILFHLSLVLSQFPFIRFMPPKYHPFPLYSPSPLNYYLS